MCSESGQAQPDTGAIARAESRRNLSCNLRAAGYPGFAATCFGRENARPGFRDWRTMPRQAREISCPQAVPARSIRRSW
jgi:hypothetical protein